MVQVKDLTELKLEDLWREVKWDEEDWCGDVKQEAVIKGSQAGLGKCRHRRLYFLFLPAVLLTSDGVIIRRFSSFSGVCGGGVNCFGSL